MEKISRRDRGREILRGTMSDTAMASSRCWTSYGKDPAQGSRAGGLRGIMAILPLAPRGVRQRRRVGSIADNCPSDLPPALPRAFVGPSATPTSGVPSPGGGVDAPDTVGSSDGACVNAVLRIRAILALLRTCSRRGVAVTLSPSHDCLPDTIAGAIFSSFGDRRSGSRAQAAPRAAAGGPARRLEPNGCGRVARHRSASHLGSAAGAP